MARNPNFNMAKRSYSPAHSTISQNTTTEDALGQLPDLSGLRDDEKQHILNVLLRDEHLRNKHLSRFMYVSLSLSLERIMNIKSSASDKVSNHLLFE